MSKIPTNKLKDLLADTQWDADWWDFLHEIDNMESEVESQYTWQWRMEVSIRKSEGWHLYTADGFDNNFEIFTWLEDNNVRFKSENNQFLIEDPQWFTAISLLWG